MRKVLLVEPSFPIPAKSKNHSSFLPIGLLKIASYLRENGTQVKLVRGVPQNLEGITDVVAFDPTEIWVTSLFTYWAEYVRAAVQAYRELLPSAKFLVGGIYASLRPKDEVKEYLGCDEVHQGVLPEAERYFPAYDLIQDTNPHRIDYQILHASRGCERRCRFCGAWKIEPQFVPERSIADKVRFKKLVFYDNNFLMNPYVEDILYELIEMKKQGKIVWCESQSGFDGRILLQRPHLARMIKEAGFRYPRIAWDWGYGEYRQIQRQLEMLKYAGYDSTETYVFMVYNWELPFEGLEKKRLKCWEWKVQIADCRYRPLAQLYDHYNPAKEAQTSNDYYIHQNWTDALVRQFRKNVREQNICVRHGLSLYSKSLERKAVSREIVRKLKDSVDENERAGLLGSAGVDYWTPDQVRYPPAA